MRAALEVNVIKGRNEGRKLELGMCSIKEVDIEVKVQEDVYILIASKRLVLRAMDTSPQAPEVSTSTRHFVALEEEHLRTE
jgi:hypothetical protein